MNKIISLTDISHRYDDREVLSDINLEVRRGDFIAITGPNGGGKSTLLKILLRLLKPTAGSVAYFDPNGNVTNALTVGYLPQKNMIDSRFPITVREVVAAGLLSPRSALRRPRRPITRPLTACSSRWASPRPPGKPSGSSRAG